MGVNCAAGCLEDMPWLYRIVSHLGFVVLGVRALPPPLVSIAGVRPPQTALHCLLIRSRVAAGLLKVFGLLVKARGWYRLGGVWLLHFGAALSCREPPQSSLVRCRRSWSHT